LQIFESLTTGKKCPLTTEDRILYIQPGYFFDHISEFVKENLSLTLVWLQQHRIQRDEQIGEQDG